MGANKYILMLIGGTALIIFLIGLIFTAFHSEPVPDYIEEALEEVTKRKGKRK